MFLPPSDIQNYVIVSKGMFVTIEAGWQSDMRADTVRLLSPTDHYHNVNQGRHPRPLPAYFHHQKFPKYSMDCRCNRHGQQHCGLHFRMLLLYTHRTLLESAWGSRPLYQ